MNVKLYIFHQKNRQIHFFRTTKPKPARWPKIYVVMRMYWKNLPMEYYDFRNKSWTSLCDVQNWRSCTSMVSHGTCIYFIGGEETDSDSPTGSRTVNRVTRYDCEKKQWISVPSMQLARRWAGSIVIDNKIYVIGKKTFVKSQIVNLYITVFDLTIFFDIKLYNFYIRK